MNALSKMLIPIAMVTTALQSQAAVVLYTDEAAYLAAVGTTTTYIDFAGSPAATVSGASFSPSLTFGSCTDSTAPGTCGTQVFHNSGGITDLGGSTANNGVASVAWRFNIADALAFGFNYVSGQIASVALVDTSLNLDLIDTSAASGFIGLVSDSAFYGAIAVNAVFPGGIGNDRYFIDDFRINAPNAVPEPTSLALAALALGAAGLGRRRASASKHSAAAQSSR